jgi:hypothetical protein
MKRCVVFLLAGALVLAAAPRTLAADPPTLPKALRKALDEKYKGWTLATVTPPGGCRVGDSPALLSGDFNSDGFDDWALQAQTPKGIKLIVAMGWPHDYRFFELETESGTAASRFLGLEHSGKKIVNPQTQSEDYLSNDTLATYSCGPDRVLYLWRSFTFTKMVFPK